MTFCDDSQCKNYHVAMKPMRADHLLKWLNGCILVQGFIYIIINDIKFVVLTGKTESEDVVQQTELLGYLFKLLVAQPVSCCYITSSQC